MDKATNTPDSMSGSAPGSAETRLVDTKIVDENTALNVMVGFIHVAHKRGVFALDESAKIWECVRKFSHP